MGKVRKFDKATSDKIAKEVLEELASFCERHGITAEDAGGTFYGNTFTARIKFSVEDAGRLNFEKYASRWGLKSEDFGREFTTRHGTFRIVGCTPSRKYAVDVVNVKTGAKVGYVPDAVVDALLTPKERAERDAKREAKGKTRRRELVAEHPEWLARMTVSPEERAELEQMVKEMVTVTT